jgi:hypothetical protein
VKKVVSTLIVEYHGENYKKGFSKAKMSTRETVELKINDIIEKSFMLNC